MTKKQKNGANAILITSVTVVVVSSVIAHIQEKRQEEKRNQEILARKVANASFMEKSELLIDDLDRRIDIAKKALLDDNFNQIIEDF